jgi:hypothetical protein
MKIWVWGLHSVNPVNSANSGSDKGVVRTRPALIFLVENSGGGGGGRYGIRMPFGGGKRPPEQPNAPLEFDSSTQPRNGLETQIWRLPAKDASADSTHAYPATEPPAEALAECVLWLGMLIKGKYSKFFWEMQGAGGTFLRKMLGFPS